MILPLMMAKRSVLPSVIDVTIKAEAEISEPPWSLVPGSANLAAGFHPICQKGFRLLVSKEKLDLFFSSIGAGVAAAVALPSAEAGDALAAGEGAAEGAFPGAAAALRFCTACPATSGNRISKVSREIFFISWG